MKKPASNKKIANSVVAASSAAVLAVYAAGYTRTESAAQKFEGQSAGRRPTSAPAPARPTSADTSAPLAPAPPVAHNPEPSKEQLAATKELVASAKALPAAVAANVAAEPVAVASVVNPPAASTPVPAPPPAPEAPVPTPVADAKPAAPNPAVGPWKDGKYEGWGSCRHGDLQALVVIEGGRITSATIAQCLTRYSCDIIETLPPQVAKRQSPNVDSVGGATQSADAFYYAVYDALAKAK